MITLHNFCALQIKRKKTQLIKTIFTSFKRVKFLWRNFISFKRFFKKRFIPLKRFILQHNSILYWGSIQFCLITWLTKISNLLVRFDSAFDDVMNTGLKTHAFLTITVPIGLFSNNFPIIAITHFLTLFLKAKTQVFETLSLLLNSWIWMSQGNKTNINFFSYQVVSAAI